MDPTVVMLAFIGALTLIATIVSFLAGFVAGAHRRFRRRTSVAFNGMAYGAEKFLVGIFKAAYYVARGHRWEERHYHH